MKLVIDIPEEQYIKICDEPCTELALAVSNGTPFDKLRTEIEGLTYYWCEVNPKSVIDDVLQIIDKYRIDKYK